MELHDYVYEEIEDMVNRPRQINKLKVRDCRAKLPVDFGCLYRVTHNYDVVYPWPYAHLYKYPFKNVEAYDFVINGRYIYVRHTTKKRTIWSMIYSFIFPITITIEYTQKYEKRK